MQIAARTGQRQVVRITRAAQCTWNHVLNVERGPLQRLVHLAVFTTPAGPVRNQFTGLSRHEQFTLRFATQ